jgi:hypothetical protein
MVDAQTAVEKTQCVSPTSYSPTGFAAGTATYVNLSEIIIWNPVRVVAVYPSGSAPTEARPVCEEQDAPTVELCELSAATVQEIRRGILEIASGRSKGPFTASELDRYLDAAAKR